MKKENLKLIETKGEVKFYEDNNGTEYQELLEKDCLYKVIDGNMKYQCVDYKNGYIIKYNLNGLYGYSIWKGNICLEDRFWSIQEAYNSIKELGFLS